MSAPGLTEALRRALAIKEPVGFLGQLLWIVRNTDEGRAGRPAAAVGVSAATWNRWVRWARNPEGRGPNPESRAKVKAALRPASANYWLDLNPHRATVTGYILWNGYKNKNPIRTVNFHGLNLADVFYSFGAGDDQGAADAFDDAIQRAYGVPVEMEEVTEVSIYV